MDLRACSVQIVESESHYTIVSAICESQEKACYLKIFQRILSISRLWLVVHKVTREREKVSLCVLINKTLQFMLNQIYTELI